MLIFMTGAHGGIGQAICEEVMGAAADDDRTVRAVRYPDVRPHECASEPDAVICCAGTSEAQDALRINLQWTIDMFERNTAAKYFIAFAGGGVGGTPSINFSAEYIASKAGIALFAEQFALRHPDKHVFAVSPGLCDTKINVSTDRGAHPSVPAKFVGELLTGKHHRLSGSLLAAQRDDLYTAKPIRLRRASEFW